MKKMNKEKKRLKWIQKKEQITFKWRNENEYMKKNEQRKKTIEINQKKKEQITFKWRNENENEYMKKMNKEKKWLKWIQK